MMVAGFVAGAGGSTVDASVDGINHLLLDLLAEARATDRPPLRIANDRAEAVLDGAAD